MKKRHGKYVTIWCEKTIKRTVALQRQYIILTRTSYLCLHLCQGGTVFSCSCLPSINTVTGCITPAAFIYLGFLYIQVFRQNRVSIQGSHNTPVLECEIALTFLLKFKDCFVVVWFGFFFVFFLGGGGSIIG